MTTILFTFCISLLVSLFATPVIGRLGLRFGAVDNINDRKMHSVTTPRCGGIAFILAFSTSFLLTSLLKTDVSEQIRIDQKILFLCLGGILTVGVGIFDDFKRLGHKVKFIFQILGASLAFYGGIRIENLGFFGVDLNLGFLSYCITLFWFLLFVNAVNLIDGLDGLAAGVCFFTSIILGFLSMLRGDFIITLYFTALAGSLLGFLRYNFNPASIFMGDGGSYFLGYMIAGLSILGSIKSPLGAVILIPVVALGVPVFDTMLSPVRRFILGKRMFRPDNGHIHHKLVASGFSKKNAVLIIYGISVLLCFVSVAMVHFRDERAGLLLIILLAVAFIFIRKIGYFEYFTNDKLFGWFKDISDEAGFTHDRRSFLNLQIDIGNSGSIPELWDKIMLAFKKLEFDMAEMHINMINSLEQSSKEDHASFQRQINFEWAGEHFDKEKDIFKDSLLKIELPLRTLNGHPSYGTLWLIKDLKRDPISHYTLRRVEHLRRTTINTLKSIEKKQNF